MPDINITTLAKLSDLDDLTSLFDGYRVFYKQESDLDGARAFLEERIRNEESVIFICKLNEKPVGFTQLYPLFSSVSMQRSWLLNDLYVAKEARGKGISKVLIQAAKDFVKSQKGKGLTLETGKDNFIGNHLYPAVDFTLDEEHNYYFWKAD